MTTPLPPIDPAAIEAYWRVVIADGAVPLDTPLPDAVGPFGDSVELAEELIALVLAGPKRATASALAQYHHSGEQPPAPGDLWVVTDGAARPRAVLRTTEIRIGPLDSVDDAFAWDEAEGDRTRATWIADHTTFFRRCLATIGRDFTADMATVFERFEVAHRAPDPHAGGRVDD